MWEVIYSFYAIAAGSLCLLSVLLFADTTRVNTVANRWLAAFYLFLAFALFQQFLAQLNLERGLPVLVHSLELTRWAVAPCFYLAVVYFVNPWERSFRQFAHFIPALFFLIFSSLFIIPRFFNPAFSVRLPIALGFVFRYVFILQMVAYWILAFRLIFIHARNIRLISSTIEPIDLSWMKQLLLGTFILAIVRIASVNSSLIAMLNPVMYCAGIFYIAFFTLRQGAIYPVATAELPVLKVVLTKNKDKERLTSDQVDALKDKVITVLTERKLFLDPSLSLADLSREVNIGIHELSYVINSGFNKNFYQLINELRVDTAKQVLLSEKTSYLDMTGIATQAGFNSKTTFNTTFKKLTGQTPTEFVRANPKNVG